VLPAGKGMPVALSQITEVAITDLLKGERAMVYLYGVKPSGDQSLVASFDTEEQLLAYVRWATLKRNDDGSFKFEQGSPLVGFSHFQYSEAPEGIEMPSDLPHNPSPSML
jgi:hypothetical protein